MDVTIGTTSVSKRGNYAFARTFTQGALHFILIAICLAAVIPLVWSVLASLKPFKELVSSRYFLPQVWTLRNYEEIITRVHFFDAMKNSFITATTVTALTLLTSSACGYVFAKYNFPGKEKVFAFILSTMMLPFAVVLVPLYVTVVNVGLQNQLGGVIVTAVWSTFGIFMMRQFIASIPTELVDASRIDGASEFRIYGQIIVPLSAAPMGALAVFTFLGQWDNYLWPLVILNSPENQTLPLLLSGLRSLYWSRYDLWTAGSMLTVVPVMVLYLCASKYFIQGVAMTGMKS